MIPFPTSWAPPFSAIGPLSASSANSPAPPSSPPISALPPLRPPISPAVALRPPISPAVTLPPPIPPAVAPPLLDGPEKTPGPKLLPGNPRCIPPNWAADKVV